MTIDHVYRDRLRLFKTMVSGHMMFCIKLELSETKDKACTFQTYNKPYLFNIHWYINVLTQDTTLPLKHGNLCSSSMISSLTTLKKENGECYEGSGSYKKVTCWYKGLNLRKKSLSKERKLSSFKPSYIVSSLRARCDDVEHNQELPTWQLS